METPLSRYSYNQMMLERLQRAAAQSSVTVANSSDPVEWIEENFWVPELKGPIVLQDYQRRCIREALSRDAKGDFKYTTILWGDIKKSIKSTVAAAVMLWRAMSTPYGQFVCVANDLKGADTRVFYYLTRALSLNPAMRHIKPRRHRVEFPNRSYAEAVAIDPTGEAGGNPDMVIFSELWGSHQDAQQRMWTEMTIPPTKFGRAFRWVETYAGYVGESPTLERLYDTGIRQGQRLWEDLEVYVNENARQFTLWNTHPRCPWQTLEYYAQQSQDLTQSEFRRIHRNQWVTSTSKFVPDAWWDACFERLPAPTQSESMVVGLDAAISGDCFGIVGVTRHPRDRSKNAVRFVRKWDPKELGHKIQYSNPSNPDDLEYPEGVIRWLKTHFNVVEFTYDEYQLYELCNRLRLMGWGWFNRFSQGSDRAIADKQLYDHIRDRHTIHDGNPELSEHIKHANSTADTKDATKVRLIKRSDAEKIDLAVCLSMADFECTRLNL